jgi:hypothetical protein
MVTPPRRFRLTLLAARYAVCRMEAQAARPAWADGAGLVSITRTADELSVVCRDERVPEDVRSEKGWRCLALEGPIPFSMTGVLASLSGALAEAGVSVFAISTFDTDYLLVPEAQLETAIAALINAGHTVVSD